LIYKKEKEVIVYLALSTEQRYAVMTIALAACAAFVSTWICVTMYSAQAASLQAQINSLQTQNFQLATQVNALENENSQLETQISSLEDQTTQLQNTIRDLEVQLMHAHPSKRLLTDEYVDIS